MERKIKYTSDKAFQIVKLKDNTVGMFFKNEAGVAKTYPVCFLDQYFDAKSQQCIQCKLGAYGLHP